jgi:SRSO17 transposase
VYWGTGTAHLLPRLLRLPDGTSRAIVSHPPRGMQHLLSRACWDADELRTDFATRPELALRMITRAPDAGTPAGWVIGDGSTEPSRQPG